MLRLYTALTGADGTAVYIIRPTAELKANSGAEALQQIILICKFGGYPSHSDVHVFGFDGIYCPNPPLEPQHKISVEIRNSGAVIIPTQV